jgi:UDP-N-acetylmuramoyl-tripeptide--D-alanyl-D-alanine ligase
MAHLTLDYLLAHAGPALVAGEAPPGVVFESITNDSRQARPGSLFLAIEAARDGHDFIGAAREAGALGVLARRVVPEAAAPGFACVLVDDPILALQRVAAARRRELEAGVIGITGSVGKTSTKEAVAQVLRRRFKVHASQGNFNNEIGLPITILDATDEHERLVLEMGAYAPGEIASLCAIAAPEMGIVTTVGPTHLESFGSIEAIEQTKGELVEALPDTGLAILNGDDERVSRMASRAACPVVTYGRGPLCVVRAVDVETRGLDGITFTLRVPGGEARVRSPLIGAHSVYPCLAAAAVGMADDMEPAEIAAALAEAPTRARLKPLPGRNGATVLDDSYNAAPISMRAALDVLAEHRGRRVAILGDMLELGEIEEEAHRGIGRHAAGAADVLYAVGPRGRWIGDEARLAGLAAVHLAEGPAEVTYQPEAGDLVLVKASRGMALERIVQRLVEGAT